MGEKPTQKSFVSRLTRPQRVLILIIAAYVLIGFGLGNRCYEVFGYDQGGSSVFEHMMWHTVHGRPFHLTVPCSADQQKPVNMFAVHGAYFWAFLVPIYAVLPGPSTLLFLQSLALGLAAVPMYLIARRVLEDEWVAVLLATAFILMPPIVSQHVNQIQEPSFLPVLLLFVFYFFLERRFKAFLIMAFVSCLNRENVPLGIGMFGLWALLDRRKWKWVVAPVVLGVVYFAFVTKIAMPYFRQGEPWHVAKQFEHLGGGPVEIIKNVFVQPQLLFGHLLGRDNIQYVIFLFQPMGWILPLLNPAAVVALPDLAANTLSNNSALKVIAWHYNLTTTAALFVSLILTIRKLGVWLGQRFGGSRSLYIVALFLLAMPIAHWFLWFQPRYFRRLPQHDVLVRALAVVPSESSVAAPQRTLAHLASREHYADLAIFNLWPRYAAQFDYVILDANERQYPPFVTQEFFDKFNRSTNYRMIFAEANVFVFQRQGPEAVWKFGE